MKRHLYMGLFCLACFVLTLGLYLNSGVWQLLAITIFNAGSTTANFVAYAIFRK